MKYWITERWEEKKQTKDGVKGRQNEKTGILLKKGPKIGPQKASI